jgi:hypothetical protein
VIALLMDCEKAFSLSVISPFFFLTFCTSHFAPNFGQIVNDDGIRIRYHSYLGYKRILGIPVRDVTDARVLKFEFQIDEWLKNATVPLPFFSHE